MVKIGRLKRTDVVRIGIERGCYAKEKERYEQKGKRWETQGNGGRRRWNDRLCVGQDLIGIEKAEI